MEANVPNEEQSEQEDPFAELRQRLHDEAAKAEVQRRAGAVGKRLRTDIDMRDRLKELRRGGYTATQAAAVLIEEYDAATADPPLKLVCWCPMCTAGHAIKAVLVVAALRRRQWTGAAAVAAWTAAVAARKVARLYLLRLVKKPDSKEGE